MKFLLVAIFPFLIGTVESSTSLELTNLQVKETASSHIITWKTISEDNCKGFEVQHSLDGEKWKTLSFMPAMEASEEGRTYQVYYETKITGNHFYRLKQIVKTGETTFSETIKVKAKKQNQNS